jgi:hypothetical protein
MAAGLGFKTFTTGEVLTAADVNGYLMQGVLVFASATARDAAITSPQEGQFAYLKDTNVTTYYTGSAWANLDTTGMTNPMTTTGDIIYSSSGSTPARLGIGTAGQVLKVNSGATAPEWGAAGATKSFTLLNTGGTALTGSNNITISSITGQDALWVVVVDASSANASSTIGVRFNSDTGTNYRQAGMQNETSNPLNYNIVNIFGGDETRIALGLMSTSTSSRICGAVSVWGATSTNPKAYVSTGGGEGAGATYTHRSYVGQGMYLGTSAISSVTINSSTGNFDNGTVYVYGSA